VDKNMPVVGYFSARTGITQPLTFRRGEETITLGGVRNDILVSESNAHHAAALAGLGIVHTMDFMVRSSIEQKKLVPILAQWRPDPLEVYIAYPPSRRYSTKVRVFADWAATLFASA
jgi:DNA-binding transcriptional LysR family regulator